MKGNAIHKVPDAREMRPLKANREEKVFIYFSARGTAKFAGHSLPGDWIVAEPHKPVSPGQEVTWYAVSGCHKLELDLPDIFEEPRQIKINGDTATATVKADAPPGLFFYEAYCNDQLAIGGSSPGVIVDH